MSDQKMLMRQHNYSSSSEEEISLFSGISGGTPFPRSVLATRVMAYIRTGTAIVQKTAPMSNPLAAGLSSRAKTSVEPYRQARRMIPISAMTRRAVQGSFFYSFFRCSSQSPHKISTNVF